MDNLLLLFRAQVIGTYSDSDTVIELSDVSRLTSLPINVNLYDRNAGNPVDAFETGAFETITIQSLATGNDVNIIRGQEGTTPVTISAGQWEVYQAANPRIYNDKASRTEDNTFEGETRLEGILRSPNSGSAGVDTITLSEQETALRWIDFPSDMIGVSLTVHVHSLTTAVAGRGFMQRSFVFGVTAGGSFNLQANEIRGADGIMSDNFEIGLLQADVDDLIVPIRHSVDTIDNEYFVSFSVTGPESAVDFFLNNVSVDANSAYVTPIDVQVNTVDSKTHFKSGASSDVTATFLDDGDFMRNDDLNATFAEKNGDASQTFEVADATLDTEAVNKGQADSDYLPAEISGTWTPAQGTLVNLTGTASIPDAFYTRLGDLVFVRIPRIDGISITSSDTRTTLVLQTTGLPGIVNATFFYGGGWVNVTTEAALSIRRASSGNTDVGIYHTSIESGSASFGEIFFHYRIGEDS